MNSMTDCGSEFEEDPFNDPENNELRLLRKFVINEEHLTNISKIVDCPFDTIYQGKMKIPGTREEGLPVAVKEPRNERDSRSQKYAIDELKNMNKIGKHPNILGLVGFVNTKTKLKIVTEFVDEGDLGKYLRKNKSKFEKQRTPLLSFAYQIADGMKKLASNHFVHRELTLHNVLVSKDETIRINNLQLARKIDKNTNSLGGAVVSKHAIDPPLKSVLHFFEKS
ncbi:hypothetical protein GCK72_013171 [Caenorhabditis remanei]|uniref:Protein kinase domain-containing protein n=1 Tax=Caenorhabditis remanei TaxID=31234 RepID=A0A6A5GN29_CAERE|nr:hypothetical protein GCK72_013171 [Caenorhabditis remanei]KAF1756717.1 hypothetical protein GCK72_013171 [Caenorhabditis remanei]